MVTPSNGGGTTHGRKPKGDSKSAPDSPCARNIGTMTAGISPRSEELSLKGGVIFGERALKAREMHGEGLAILEGKRMRVARDETRCRPAVRGRGVAIAGKRLQEAIEILRREARGWNAPVVSLLAAEGREPLRVLVGCLLSLRTRDEVTALAAERFFARAPDLEAMLSLSEEEIARLIRPVGFYRVKARTLKLLARQLAERFGGRVPSTLEELLTLPGVGLKTANLVLSQAYGHAAICVDTHVHRITNRWGLVKTRRPEETEAVLRKRVPQQLWKELNPLLVAFGQTVCRPVSPRCSQCPIAHLCPRIGVGQAR